MFRRIAAIVVVVIVGAVVTFAAIYSVSAQRGQGRAEILSDRAYLLKIRPHFLFVETLDGALYFNQGGNLSFEPLGGGQTGVWEPVGRDGFAASIFCFFDLGTVRIDMVGNFDSESIEGASKYLYFDPSIFPPLDPLDEDDGELFDTETFEGRRIRAVGI